MTFGVELKEKGNESNIKEREIGKGRRKEMKAIKKRKENKKGRKKHEYFIYFIFLMIFLGGVVKKEMKVIRNERKAGRRE